MSEAEKQLREHQQQLDAHGAMVGVSRQAVDEVLAELAALRELINQHNLDCSCPCEDDSSDTAYFDYHGYSGDCPAHGKITTKGETK